jgi:hypothetical protein
MNNIPNKLILTCNITGKQVTWTNKTIIASKIAKHGSLEAFLSSYVSKGAGKVSTNMKKVKQTKEQSVESFKVPGMKKVKQTKEQSVESLKVPSGKIIKPILEQGVKLGEMTEADYKRFSRVQTYHDGTQCTIDTYTPIATS